MSRFRKKPKTYSIDHDWPIYLGGDCSISNAALVTIEANQAKHKLAPEEFLLLCWRILKNKGFQVVPPEKYQQTIYLSHR